MSASNEWTEWHLTPRGWERGSEKVDFSPVEVREPPNDRVLTVCYREHMSSTFSKLKKSTSTEWASDDKALIKQLKAEFGDAPTGL